MTILCLPKVTQHHQGLGALLPLGRTIVHWWASFARPDPWTFGRFNSFTIQPRPGANQCAIHAAGVTSLPADDGT